MPNPDAMSIFLDAVDNHRPEDWQDFLDSACRDDDALRSEIEKMLQAHVALGTFHDDVAAVGVADPTTMSHSGSPAVGTQIGPYKLRERIGEGGMGVVYVAEQSEPIQRKVALKIIRPGTASKDVVARFEVERQALAMMDHPNIAKVLDGGATDSGQPYFVMELVPGLQVTQYCDQHELSTADRLKLFVAICRAVQHAHHKGMIHRDLKPSNIIVSEIDGAPVPKVIDFGVAKAVSQTLTAGTIYTQFSQVVGTPLYMSPEQTSLGVVDIDTRSDVYSLGVLLYELLTGNTPFDSETLKQAGFDEMRRIIREDEPPKPSVMVSTLNAEARSTISQCRKSDPRKLSDSLSGELDWLVMKALEKDRNRRYESASALADDVNRYIVGDAVEACPPSTLYHVSKFASRNKPFIASSAAVLAVLLLGIAGTSYQAMKAEEARVEAANRAESERLAKLSAQAAQQQAEQAAAKEKAANEQAQKRLSQIETGNEIITSIFTDLNINDVRQGSEPLEAVLAERLVVAADQLVGDSIGDPVTVAQLQIRLANSLLSLGYPEDATRLLLQARDTCTAELGGDHPQTLDSMDSIARAHQAAGKLELAVPLFEQTLTLMKAKLGDDHPQTLTTMNNLALAYRAAGKLELAVPLFEQTLTLQKAKLGDDHTDALTTKNNLARAYLAAGKLDKAARLLEQSLQFEKAQLGEDHPETLASMSNLASTYQDSGQPERALPLLERTLALTKAKRGDDHPQTLSSMNNLARAYLAAGKLDLALPMFERRLELQEAKLGNDHPYTLTSMKNLASTYRSVGKLDQATQLLEQAVTLTKTKFGGDHPETLSSMNYLAVFYRDVGQPERALPLLEQTLSLMKAEFGEDHPRTLTIMMNFALAHRYAGKLDQAARLYEQILPLQKAQLGEDHPYRLATMYNLAVTYQAAGKLDQAVLLLEQRLQLEKAKIGDDHPEMLDSMNFLAEAYLDAGRLTDATNLRKEQLAIARKRYAPDSPQLAHALAQVGTLLLEAKSFTEAELILRECYEVRSKSMPDHWLLFNAQSMLGEALVGQMKYAEAEPLLLAGYEGMKHRAEAIPKMNKVCLTEAVQRLVELYTALANPADVAKWQIELERSKAALESSD